MLLNNTKKDNSPAPTSLWELFEGSGSLCAIWAAHTFEMAGLGHVLISTRFALLIWKKKAVASPCSFVYQYFLFGSVTDVSTMKLFWQVT